MGWQHCLQSRCRQVGKYAFTALHFAPGRKKNTERSQASRVSRVLPPWLSQLSDSRSQSAETHVAEVKRHAATWTSSGACRSTGLHSSLSLQRGNMKKPKQRRCRPGQNWKVGWMRPPHWEQLGALLKQRFESSLRSLQLRHVRHRLTSLCTSRRRPPPQH